MKRSLAVWVAVAGCHHDAAPAPAQVLVTLRDPGREPLRAVMYRPTAHPRAARFKTHGAVTTFDWKLTDASAAGARYRFTLSGLDYPGQPPSSEEAEVTNGLIGKVTGTVESDAHGRATAANDTERYRIAPSIRDVTTMAIVPLPTEPIGAGARWSVTGQVSASLPITAAIDYEAIAVSVEGATVRWTGHYASDSGDKMSDIDGTVTIRFDDLLPIHGEMHQRPVLASAGNKPIEFAFAIE